MIHCLIPKRTKARTNAHALRVMAWRCRWRGVGVQPTSTGAPDEDARHGVVPDSADGGAQDAREPPDRIPCVDPACDRNIADGADRTYATEPEEARDQVEPFQPLVAIGEDIVEQEVADHRHEGGDG